MPDGNSGASGAGAGGAGGEGGQGSEGSASQSGGTQQSGQQSTQQSQQSQQDSRTFSQADVDRIVQDRLARESAKYADYDDLKKRVTEADEAGKTELTKAQERAQKAEEAAKAAEDRSRLILRRGAIISEATSQGAVDADTVYALLASDDTIVVAKDDSVAGARDAVAALLKAKPFLKGEAGGKPSGGKPGGQFGGNDPASVRDRIAQLESEGKHGEARRLKIEQGLGLMGSNG